ncbi:MAG TPA: pepsin/retropepsin-like aspartic protease family protein [Hyphomonadaceae bacterium]|jgi:predicted aspartyl protease|nr:pepsin/retropepsin-like aspartic protease family protein [Hyphomonadaceae bacterium]
MRQGRGFLLILLAFAGLSAVAQRQPPAWLEMAIATEAVDPLALRNAAGDVEEQKKHAAAIELAWLRRDAEAVAALRASADTAKEAALRLDALNLLTGVYMRAGDYALAAAAARESQKLGARFAKGKPAQSDLLVAAEALRDTPPMTMSGKPTGVLPLKMEKDGIPRARIAINGKDEEAVLDTGATFSAVSLSVAKEAGIRPLKASLRVAAGGGPEASAGIGVAEELVIAETTFRNVVVLIVPDDDMDIFGSEARVGAIIGLPVFLKMGSIAMLPDKGALTFAFRPASGEPGEASNLRLHKLNLVLSGTLKTPAPAPVNFLLDTGANATFFNARFAKSFPDLIANAPKVFSTSAVIGEASLARQARRLGELRFEVGGTGFAMTGADVYEDERPAYHGILGQDVLRAGFAADFDR